MNLSDRRYFSRWYPNREKKKRKKKKKLSRHDVLDLMNTEHKNTVCHFTRIFVSFIRSFNVFFRSICLSFTRSCSLFHSLSLSLSISLSLLLSFVLSFPFSLVLILACSLSFHVHRVYAVRTLLICISVAVHVIYSKNYTWNLCN